MSQSLATSSDETNDNARQIIDALDKKRKQLDQEIAEFRAKKEREFRAFEQQLRDKGKEARGLGRAQSGRAVQEKKPSQVSDAATGQALPAASHYNGHANGHGRSMNTAIAGENSSASDDMRSSHRIGETLEASSSTQNPLRPKHEREQEFQGLFTPSYLPLLDSTATADRRSSNEILESPSFAAARRNSTAMLSSSAENMPPAVTSPLARPSRPLSSSVPPEQSLQKRRSLSSSSISVSGHRSSLRDPNQPRSPKRVLFSIDNTVVSPSTSPVAQRSAPVPLLKPSDTLGDSRGYEKFEVVRNNKEDDPPPFTFGANPQSGSPENSILNSKVNGWNNPPTPFRHVAEASNTSPLVGGEEFEELGNDDDVFTFDEDMTVGESKKPDEAKGDDDFEDEDVVKGGKDPLLAGSPHAGSLPIEIKWPGRRELSEDTRF